LNRATTLLKIRNFDGAILDLDDIEKKIDAQGEEEKKDPFYPKMMARVLVKRAAAFAWLSDFDNAERDLERALKEYKGIFSEVELEFIRSDLQKIKMRNESNTFKKEGDSEYAQGNFESSLKEYNKALEKDPTNEYALGNIGLIYLKRTDYNKCIEYTDRALAEVNNFISDTKSFNSENHLEVKLLLRRGKSYQMLEQYEKAKEDLDECVKLDRRNKEAANMLKKVQAEINDIIYKENKTEAERLFREQKWTEALEHFEQ
jgi:tetratricopeptide (TPR) repeat protein